MSAQPVAPGQVEAVADAVARGFHDNEIWRWVVPDEARCLKLMRRAYRLRLRGVYTKRGEAWTTPGCEGGAFWIPPGQPKRRPREELAEAFALLPGIGLGGARRGTRIERLLDEHHPHEPHWYLECLSIAPEHQRQGHGAALLAPVLDRCDRDDIPAFLETNRESNLPYYRRFGFELTERIGLPDSPPLWLMWREPRQRPASLYGAAGNSHPLRPSSNLLPRGGSKGETNPWRKASTPPPPATNCTGCGPRPRMPASGTASTGRRATAGEPPIRRTFASSVVPPRSPSSASIAAPGRTETPNRGAHMSQTPTQEQVVDAARQLDQDEFSRADLADKLEIERTDMKQGFKAARKAGRLEKVREDDSGKSLFRLTAE